MYFLIPREVGSDWAVLWAASVDEPLLEHVPVLVGGSPHQDIGPWEYWPGDVATAQVRHQEIRVTGLQPRERYDFQLLVEGRSVARADVTTLPAIMPTLGDKPFTVMLGSCFSHRQDPGGTVGKTFAALSSVARPDLKLLAGDQVYLDAPWYRFVVPSSQAGLRASFMDSYIGTWGQGRQLGEGQGFSHLLASGANYFTSDDHEFWNNAPNPGAYAVNTWSKSGRDEWWAAASGLYRTFQTPRVITRFDVPPVSFLIVDTRIDRDDKRANFMTSATEAEVKAWVEGLKGPGVMVVGQPVLQTASTWVKGTFADWNLPDYEQYKNLARILAASRQSLVVLTGDVHFGRVARARLGSGKELIEIISSPMALVDESAHGNWVEAPDRFPASPDIGIARGDVATDPRLKATAAHFLTLEFTRRGPGANLCVRYWPVQPEAGMPSDGFGKTMWEQVIN